MDYNHIYVFGVKFTRGALCAYALTRSDFDCVKLFRGEMEDMHDPMGFNYLMGKNPYDLVSSGYAICSLLSDRIIGLFREHRVIGWKTYPAILYDKKGAEIKGYSIFFYNRPNRFCRLGKVGKICQISLCTRRRQGKFDKGDIYPDSNGWDGSDIFTAEGGTAFTFVTKKVRDLLVKHKATNILLTKVTEFEMLDPDNPEEEIDKEQLKSFMKRMGFDAEK